MQKAVLAVWIILMGAMLGASGGWAKGPEVSLRPQYRPGSVLPDGADALLRRFKIGGDLGFALFDSDAQRWVETRHDTVGFAPASVAKSLTGLYAMSQLGADYTFKTRVLANGSIVNGTLTGDLILAGGGDPLLDTDHLLELAERLHEQGLRTVNGRFIYWAGAIPEFRQIVTDQPVQVGYNPAIGGLSLNFNRVYFDWKEVKGGYRVAMDARSERVRPPVAHIKMQVVDRATPVFDFAQKGMDETWTVAKRALGKEGGRWLPVRDAGAYSAAVFAQLARDQGITLPNPISGQIPKGANVLAEIQSPPLAEIVQAMLKYSNNMVAESLGLAASINRGARPVSLAQSAKMMGDWAKSEFSVTSVNFRDHSGLNDASRVSPRDMVMILEQGRRKIPNYVALMKPIKPRTANGDLDQSGQAEIMAKTGTLNFVTALAGYLRDANGGNYVFAIFSQDIAARTASNTDNVETPKGAQGWRLRARNIQSGLLYRWARLKLVD